MTMTILITSCVWVVFFTILNQFEQRNYLKLQDQRDELRDLVEDILEFEVVPYQRMAQLRIIDTFKRTGGAK